MNRIVHRVVHIAIFFLCSLPATGNDQAQAKPDPLQALPAREIGPAAFGGRIADVEAVPSDPDTIFVAAASGGIFRSANNGVTWKPVFDEEAVMLSVGDIAIAPSDPDIVWAGTGEPNSRQSSSWGHGVYRSLDGGENWEYMGLAETHHIGRVVIHPRDPDIVFVAALGHLWGPNNERGLYRTRDGGKTWKRVLSANEDTGVVEVAMEDNGRILYAATYQRRRRAWGFVGGGPHSALYRSLDGGDTWDELANGIPEGDTGRIGVSISRSHPNIVYAIIENKDGGVFRSEDRGDSWTRVNELNPRPMYYSQIRVDPANPNKVWVLGSPLFVSEDGGKTFESDWTGEKIHVDHHALWINPNDPDHLILGNDGGLYFSYDGARNWDFIDNLPIAQYYAIAVDNRDPYWVYGGTQDNGTWALPSRTYSELGITNLDVMNVAYGDGFFAAVDPRDPDRIYAESQNGRLYRVDAATREEKGIRPVPTDPEEEYRFNWNSPLILSPHDPDVVYYGGNKLFRSADRGHSWAEASPDLTRGQEWKKLGIMGVERDEDTLSRDDGTSAYGTLTSISESPLAEGLLLVGSDDGLVHMTRDGGENWSDLTDRFELPGHRWVSRVLASAHSADVAYATFDGHEDDDFTPYVFKTEDGGSTWRDISGNLPPGTVVNDIEEHHRNPDLLFVGSEWGVFTTLDGGRSWTRMEEGLPNVPADDLIVEERENDLVVGTHGRGIFIVDDLSALEHWGGEAASAKAHLFPVRTATQFYTKRLLPVPGASEFSGPNPPEGALLTYRLAESLTNEDGEAQPAKILIERDGEVVRELKGPGEKGAHRVAWDLREPLSFEAGQEDQGWFGPARGPFVMPGQYLARLKAGEAESTSAVQVRVDPDAEAEPQALRRRYEASAQVNEMLGRFTRAAEGVAKMKEAFEKGKKAFEDQDGGEGLKEDIEKTSERLEELGEWFKSGWRSNKFLLLDLLGQLQASTSAPTESQMRQMGHLEKALEENVAKVNQLARELPGLLLRLEEEGILTRYDFPIVEGRD